MSNHREAAQPGLSCLMAFYSKDDPQHFDLALRSVAEQTRPPDEVVLVQDGPVPESLLQVASAYAERLPMQLVVLPINVGLGRALARGVEAARFDWIARMDADDLCRPQRLATQEHALRNDPQLLIVGSAMEEFRSTPGDMRHGRPVACGDLGIRRMARTRNPFNHMTVMFSRAAVRAAGNYRHMPGFEDYDLWLRLLQQPGRVMNLPEVLMDVRVGNGMLARRRGWHYARAELAFLARCRDEGLLTTGDALRSAAMRLPARLAPATVLEWLYRKALRRG